MKQEFFKQELGNLFPQIKSDVAECWIAFAKECVNLNQFSGYERKGTDEYELEQWLSSIFMELQKINNEYGKETATRISNLSSEKNCLYPLEMEECAEYLQTGTMEEFLWEQGFGEKGIKLT